MDWKQATADELWNEILRRRPDFKADHVLGVSLASYHGWIWFQLHARDVCEARQTLSAVKVCNALNELNRSYPVRYTTDPPPPRVSDIVSEKHTLPVASADRKNYPLCEGLLRYFPAALAAVSRISKLGNEKHNPGEPLHHARGKSADHADCILRHLIDLPEDFGKGLGYDEGGHPQVAYIAWRALALAQEWLEKHGGAPRAPNARD